MQQLIPDYNMIQKLFSFLKLIRTVNLLIIAFTMCMVRYAIVKPIIDKTFYKLEMPDLHFLILVFSVMTIAAAGYIINDYFDMKIDRINKPENAVVGIDIKRRWAMLLHFLLNIIGIAGGVYVSYRADMLSAGIVLFVFTASALWFYSTNFKKQFLTGNLLISVLAALIPVTAGIYDLKWIQNYYGSLIGQYNPDLFTALFTFLGVFSFFAFILNFIREIIKDAEDIEGDKEFDCKTLPLVMGIKYTKWILFILLLFVFSILTYFNYEYIFDKTYYFPFIYIVLGLQIPVLYLAFYALSIKSKSGFKTASTITKLIMLSGVCFWFVLKYLVDNGIWIIGH